MRQDTATFALKNVAVSKSPRYVIELSFDSDNTVLWYFTSHTDCALPGGVNFTANVLAGLSGTSQTLAPDKANASIGNINFSLIDKAEIITDTLGDELVLGRSTRRQRVRVYVGFEGLAWADYTLVQTQLVSEIAFIDGVYQFRCTDIQREMRKDIFEPAKTTLAQSLTAAATTVEVYTTAAFEMVAHGTSYSDAPSSTVGYVKIEDEIIRYTGKTATQFTGCTRGALNTLAVAHAVDPGTAADRRTEVKEYVYLEMPALKLIYAILTGVLYGQGGATLPTSWHLGIDTSYVRLADYISADKVDLWNTADDEAGFVVRFTGIDKTDGKKFIEAELALLCGVFLPVYADGALGLKRMSNILSGAGYVQLLDESNVVSHGELTHDFTALHNIIQIEWNWEPAHEDFTRVNLLADSDSIIIHGRADTLKLAFRGLHGSLHSSTMLSQRFDALRDRFTGPPLKLSAQVLPSLNTLEVGDVVRVRLLNVRDFVANDFLDRSFEVQNISIDWITGNVGLKLFASSRAPKESSATSDATVISNAWYASEGTALSSVLTISGSNPGHVTASGTLNGTTDMNAAGSIFYYEGDLVIDPGVTINITGNVQLRIRGVLQNNGTISGVGGGIAGAAAVSPATSNTHHNLGTVGFLGSTEAGGGFYVLPTGFLNSVYFNSVRGAIVAGLNSVMPSFNITWDGVDLVGLPSDLRGTSGSGGMPSQRLTAGGYDAGGAGGNSGAGLMLISRGFAQGVAGVVNTSGAAGALAAELTDPGFTQYQMTAGSGAGGAPGGFLILLDGATASATGLTDSQFVALNGDTKVRAGRLISSSVTFAISSDPQKFYSHYVGTGDGSLFARPNLSGSRGGARVQYVPGSGTVEEDPAATVLIPPTNIGLASGPDEMLLGGDGTVIVRIKVMWTPSVDVRTLGYDLQFKRSSDSVWSSAPVIIGRDTTTAWIAGVRDGINYDVRIRSAGDVRLVSDWLTITNYLVIGKDTPPANVTGFSASQNGIVVVFKWDQVADEDLAGYEIRYIAQGLSDWDAAVPLTKVTRGTQITSAAVPPGSWTMLIKARDTSFNYSAAAASYDLDVFNVNDVIVGADQAPDWLGTKTNCEVHWTGKLVPSSTLDADQLTLQELFEQFVPYPPTTCTYEAPAVDLGFVYEVRAWASFEASLGPGITEGFMDPKLQIDYHSGAGYDGFEDWTIGTIDMRYFKSKFSWDTTDGLGYVSSFKPSLDVQPHEESGVVTVAVGGTAVVFVERYYATPNIQLTVSGGTALHPSHYNLSATGFSVKVFDAAGVDVGGTVHWRAYGD